MITLSPWGSLASGSIPSSGKRGSVSLPSLLVRAHAGLVATVMDSGHWIGVKIEGVTLGPQMRASRPSALSCHGWGLSWQAAILHQPGRLCSHGLFIILNCKLWIIIHIASLAKETKSNLFSVFMMSLLNSVAQNTLKAEGLGKFENSRMISHLCPLNSAVCMAPYHTIWTGPHPERPQPECWDQAATGGKWSF